MYELINVIRKLNKPNKYIIKDRYNQVEEMNHHQVKNLLAKGNTISGLKIARDGRIIPDKRFKSTIENKINNNISTYEDCLIYTGDNLKYIAGMSKRFIPRDVVYDIVNYVENIASHKIFILHGIRRVGKTVAIKIAIEELLKTNSKDDIIYLEITSETTIDSLLDKIKNFRHKIIFIDEITRAKGFIEKASYLSDILVGINKNKIIVAGTESLAFPISAKTSLYDRAIFNRCTLIPFQEYVRLFRNTNDDYNESIRDYMAFGGALLRTEFLSYENMDETMSSVVISNIRLIIDRNKSLIRLEKDLTQLAKLNDEVISYLIYSLIANSVSPKKYISFVNSLTRLGKDKANILSEASGIEEERFIGNQNIDKGISNRDVLTVMNVLEQLNIIAKIRNLAIGNENGIKAITEVEICTLIQALLFRLRYKPSASLDRLFGDLMENMIIGQIVMYKIINKNKKSISVGYSKYSYNNKEYEVDCIAIIEEIANGMIKSKAYAIEIKHGNKAKSDWKNNLIHEKLPNAIGILPQNLSRYIVYNGKTVYNDGIQYINAYDFMMNLDKWLNN